MTQDEFEYKNGVGRSVEAKIDEYIRWIKIEVLAVRLLGVVARKQLRDGISSLLAVLIVVLLIQYSLSDSQKYGLIWIFVLIVTGNYILWVYKHNRSAPVNSFPWRGRFLLNSVFLVVLLFMLFAFEIQELETNSDLVGGLALYLILRDMFEFFVAEMSSISEERKRNWLPILSHLLAILTGLMAVFYVTLVQPIAWVVLIGAVLIILYIMIILYSVIFVFRLLARRLLCA